MCRQEFRVQLETDTADHMGLLLNLHPPPPYLPLHVLVFRAQTSTQISIHSLSASSSMQRGERRVRKDRKGRSVSDCLGSFGCCLLVFCCWFCCIYSRIIISEGEEGRRNCSPFSSRLFRPHGELSVTISVHGTQGWEWGASHYVNILLPLDVAEPVEDPAVLSCGITAASVPSSPFSSCLVQPTRE